MIKPPRDCRFDQHRRDIFLFQKTKHNVGGCQWFSERLLGPAEEGVGSQINVTQYTNITTCSTTLLNNKKFISQFLNGKRNVGMEWKISKDKLLLELTDIFYL